MSTGESWHFFLRRKQPHRAMHSPLSVVSQCKLVSGSGVMKRRSTPPYRQWRIQGVGAIDRMHFKTVKILHEKALFLRKIFKNFPARGHTPDSPYPSAPYSKFLDPSLPTGLSKAWKKLRFPDALDTVRPSTSTNTIAYITP